jgi:hypothetical protein
MSIPVLIQTYDEVRRLAIAGSVVAPGDFRLKKLLPPLDQAGQKAPVFARVGEAIRRLVESDEKTSASALLELTTLVTAILYTQGETGIEGELVPIKTVPLKRPKTQVSARVLKPLQEALTTTGSGRLEIIRDAFEQGACHDLRLIAPALSALDDSYAEVADFVLEKILPLYGAAIVPELQATFDPKGRAGHVRRLLLMHQLDPEAARPFVRHALEEGSTEVRVSAIRCLGDSPEDLPFLLEQVKAKAKDVRSAALKALGSSGAADAVQVLCEAIKGADFALAVEPIRASRSPVLTSFIFEAAQKQLDVILASKEKDTKKLSQHNERMCLILECLRQREDGKTEKLLLKMFDHLEQLDGVKGEPGGKDMVERLVSVMAVGPRGVQSALADAHATVPAECLGPAFIAACRCSTAADVFKDFSPYLTATVKEKKKSRDTAYAKREAIVALLLQKPASRWPTGSYLTIHAYLPVPKGQPILEQEDLAALASLDPRWLDLAVQLGRTDLVQALAVPGHAGANALLSETLKNRLSKPDRVPGYGEDLWRLVSTMIVVDHPGATDSTLELIKRSSMPGAVYTYFWLGNLIPRLPKTEALPKLEALLPTLPEKMIDYLLPFVNELKQDTPAAESVRPT